jgi:hypothetical protein
LRSTGLALLPALATPLVALSALLLAAPCTLARISVSALLTRAGSVASTFVTLFVVIWHYFIYLLEVYGIDAVHRVGRNDYAILGYYGRMSYVLPA